MVNTDDNDSGISKGLTRALTSSMLYMQAHCLSAEPSVRHARVSLYLTLASDYPGAQSMFRAHKKNSFLCQSLWSIQAVPKTTKAKCRVPHGGRAKLTLPVPSETFEPGRDVGKLTCKHIPLFNPSLSQRVSEEIEVTCPPTL